MVLVVSQNNSARALNLIKSLLMMMIFHRDCIKEISKTCCTNLGFNFWTSPRPPRRGMGQGPSILASLGLLRQRQSELCMRFQYSARSITCTSWSCKLMQACHSINDITPIHDSWSQFEIISNHAKTCTHISCNQAYVMPQSQL